MTSQVMLDQYLTPALNSLFCFMSTVCFLNSLLLAFSNPTQEAAAERAARVPSRNPSEERRGVEWGSSKWLPPH